MKKILILIFYLTQSTMAIAQNNQQKTVDNNVKKNAATLTGGSATNDTCIENGKSELEAPETLPIMIKDCDNELKAGGYKISSFTVSRSQPLGKDKSVAAYTQPMAEANMRVYNLLLQIAKATKEKAASGLKFPASTCLDINDIAAPNAKGYFDIYFKGNFASGMISKTALSGQYVEIAKFINYLHAFGTISKLQVLGYADQRYISTATLENYVKDNANGDLSSLYEPIKDKDACYNTSKKESYISSVKTNQILALIRAINLKNVIQNQTPNLPVTVYGETTCKIRASQHKDYASSKYGEGLWGKAPTIKDSCITRRSASVSMELSGIRTMNPQSPCIDGNLIRSGLTGTLGIRSNGAPMLPNGCQTPATQFDDGTYTAYSSILKPKICEHISSEIKFPRPEKNDAKIKIMLEKSFGFSISESEYQTLKDPKQGNTTLTISQNNRGSNNIASFLGTFCTGAAKPISMGFFFMNAPTISDEISSFVRNKLKATDSLQPKDINEKGAISISSKIVAYSTASDNKELKFELCRGEHQRKIADKIYEKYGMKSIYGDTEASKKEFYDLIKSDLQDEIIYTGENFTCPTARWFMDKVSENKWIFRVMDEDSMNTAFFNYSEKIKLNTCQGLTKVKTKIAVNYYSNHNFTTTKYKELDPTIETKNPKDFKKSAGIFFKNKIYFDQNCSFSNATSAETAKSGFNSLTEIGSGTQVIEKEYSISDCLVIAPYHAMVACGTGSTPNSNTTQNFKRDPKRIEIFPNFSSPSASYRLELTGENITNAQIIKALEEKIGATSTVINSILCKSGEKTPSADEFKDCADPSENKE